MNFRPSLVAFAVVVVLAGVALAAVPKTRAIEHASSETFKPTSTVTVEGPLVINAADTNPAFTGLRPRFNTGAWVDAGVVINSTLMVDGGLTVGLQGGPVTLVVPWSSTIDFGTSTTTCTESNSITVNGAVANCSCVIGPPSTGGSTNAAYTCYVSASNAIKARHCAAGTADDPASATFSGFVICP